MKRSVLYTAVVMSAIGLTAPIAGAEEACKAAEVKAAAKVLTMTGTLAVEKDANDAITSVVLNVSGKDSEGEETVVAYKVTLDENGKKLAALDGKKVEVSAVLNKKEIKSKNEDGETETKTELWLTIKSSKEIAVKAETTESDE